ncbi:MAG: HEAT repeat domain-containing protein [Myxococcales bacterium]|nr:HEAT repeat domain-containing protein [Myxococcales bacterium]
MPALSDQSFSPKAYAHMAVVGLALLALLGLVVFVYFAYQKSVEDPRLLRSRFDDPPGQMGMSTVRVSAMGDRAVPTLLEDLRSHSAERRTKAMELLGSIEDPRVIPALARLVANPDISVQLTAMAALARTAKAEAAVPIWLLASSRNEIVRYRAWVAIGLCGGVADQHRMLALAQEIGDTDRYVLAWAIGHMQRRFDSLATGNKGYVSAAADSGEDAEVARVQAEVDATLQQIDQGIDLPQASKKLAELTDGEFARGDFGHQIALQVLAIAGPRQWRGLRAPEAVVKPAGSGVQLQPGGRDRLQAP